jgi:hypothetical protein
MKVQISKARQSKIAIAYKAGIKAMTLSNDIIQVPNPYSENHGMPEMVASVQGSLWHAFEAGKYRTLNQIEDAGTMMRNARYFMRRATERDLA